MALYLIWKHFPELKGEGYDFKYLYFELGINTIVNQFINNLDGLIIRIQNLLILYLFLPL